MEVAARQPAREITAIPELSRLLRRHAALVLELGRREITDRYAGQFLGAAWAVLHPLILIGVYVLVFVVVFRIKIGGTHELPLDFTAYLLAGLLPWLGMQEGLIKGSSAITNHASLVKQVVFPLEVLPVKTSLASMVSVLVSLIVVLGYILVKFQRLPVTALLLPLLFAVQIVTLCGLAYALAALGAFMRDTKDLVQVGTLVCQYTLPIFFLPAFLPDVLRPLLFLNPFSYLIWCYQDALFFGRFEHPYAWIIAPVLGLAFLEGGYRVFRWSKTLFGNVL